MPDLLHYAFGVLCALLCEAIRSALGVQEPQQKVHVDIRAALTGIDLSKVGYWMPPPFCCHDAPVLGARTCEHCVLQVAHRCMPDPDRTDTVAGKAATQRKKGIAHPFPFVEVADFLPAWCMKGVDLEGHILLHASFMLHARLHFAFHSIAR